MKIVSKSVYHGSHVLFLGVFYQTLLCHSDEVDGKNDGGVNAAAGALLNRLAVPSGKMPFLSHFETVKSQLKGGKWSLKDGFVSHPPHQLSFTKIPDSRHYYERSVLVWDPVAQFRHLFPGGIDCPNRKEGGDKHTVYGKGFNVPTVVYDTHGALDLLLRRYTCATCTELNRNDKSLKIRQSFNNYDSEVVKSFPAIVREAMPFMSINTKGTKVTTSMYRDIVIQRSHRVPARLATSSQTFQPYTQN